MRVRRVGVLSLGLFDITAKLETVISHIGNKQCEGDGEMIEKHLLKEFEIFEATGKRTKDIKLLLNSLNTFPSTSIEY